MDLGRKWDAPDIVPTLTYKDFLQAVRWLERVFGFSERKEARLTWPGGGMAWFEIGNALLNISTPGDIWRKSSESPGLMMKIYVDDVDAHFRHAKAQGAKIISGPENGFWGGRIYRVLDHEGHQWEVSQRGLDLAADLWKLPANVTRGIPR